MHETTTVPNQPVQPRTTRKFVVLVAAIFTLMGVMAGTAIATHVFNDVPDGAFYAEAAEWAAENEITLGCGNNNFCPNRNVTRGENITFAQRYDENVVQPSLGLAKISRSDQGRSWNGNQATEEIEFIAPQGGVVMITYVASAGRDFQDPSSDMSTDAIADISINGFELGQSYGSWANNALDSEDNATLTVTALGIVNEGSNTITGSITADRSAYLHGQTLTVLFVPKIQF